MAKSKTREVEFFVCFGSPGGTWNTTFLPVPNKIADKGNEQAIKTSVQSKFDHMFVGEQVGAWGVYHIPAED